MSVDMKFFVYFCGVMKSLWIFLMRYENLWYFQLFGPTPVPFKLNESSLRRLLGIKYSALKLWNDMPVDIREASTLKCFKKKLKAHLLANQK